MPKYSAGGQVRMSAKSRSCVTSTRSSLAHAAATTSSLCAAQAVVEDRFRVVAGFREQALELGRQVFVELDPDGHPYAPSGTIRSLANSAA